MALEGIKVSPEYFFYMQEGDMPMRNAESSTVITSEAFSSIFRQSFCQDLDDDGQGLFLFTQPRPNQNQWNELIAPHFFSFDLKVEKEVIKQQLYKYLTCYGQGI
ncbi:MAG: hypothetical protein AAF135_26120 [Bacteroidota bacterium]